MRHVVRLLNAGLSERPKMLERGDEIVALGFLGVDDLVAPDGLRCDTYQREILKNSASLDSAVRDGITLPTVTLGVRGQNFHTNGEAMEIKDPVFIIDGLQRISAIRRFVEESRDSGTPVPNILLGAEVRFGTTYDTEKRMFHILNSKRIAVSPNVLLRNMRDKYRVLGSLYGYSVNDTKSPLLNRVQWGQRAATGELLTAMIIVRSMLKLYQHVSTRGTTGPKGSSLAGGVEGTSQWLENKVRVIGLEKFRENLHTLFDIIDSTWGLRHIESNASRPHLRFSFMQGFCMVLSEHTDFWKAGNKLYVPPHIKKRLEQFPFQRDDIARILRGTAGSGSGTAVADILIRHINRGRSTRKLTQRNILVQD